MTRRTVMLAAVLLALLMMASIWAYGQMAEACDAALRAERDLAACRRLAREIERHRKKPTVISGEERLSGEMTRLIERAAIVANLPTNKIINITPQPARRLGETVYKEKSTLILLRDVPLKQVVTLVYHILQKGNGLRDRFIHLRAPSRQDTGNLWTADLEVGYLIYDPPRLRP